MKILLRWLFNPGILISTITIFLVFKGETLVPLQDSYGLIFIIAALLVYICIAWFTSNRTLRYTTPRECLYDILADTVAYTFNISICFLWYFLAPTLIADNAVIVPHGSTQFLSHTGKYYSIQIFILLMSVATFIELAFSASNALRAMYLRNPVNIDR